MSSALLKALIVVLLVQTYDGGRRFLVVPHRFAHTQGAVLAARPSPTSDPKETGDISPHGKKNKKIPSSKLAIRNWVISVGDDAEWQKSVWPADLKCVVFMY